MDTWREADTETESYCLTILYTWMFSWVFMFLRMLPSRLQLQPHRPSLLLKMLPPPTRTLLLTSSWCRAARYSAFVVWFLLFFLLVVNYLDCLLHSIFLTYPHWTVFLAAVDCLVLLASKLLFDDSKNCMEKGFYTFKPLFKLVYMHVCIGSGRPHPTTRPGGAWQPGQTRGP